MKMSNDNKKKRSEFYGHVGVLFLLATVVSFFQTALFATLFSIFIGICYVLKIGHSTHHPIEWGSIAWAIGFLWASCLILTWITCLHDDWNSLKHEWIK